MATLEKAISIALEAHAGILDKAAAPYILHPLRVMFQMDSLKEMIVAVLHDVIEDSDLSLAMLREIGFSNEVLETLDCLTHREEESYEDYIRRLASNPMARKIKMADLKDNLNIARIRKLTEKDWTRVQKYHQALEALGRKKPIEKPAAKEPYTLFLGEL